ncbi:MAG: radical SAM family heme chaperone HemW [Planctomycetes bacterium]|nr:radical SAM family heme chaperone HemW [Planctomycetota bacterium]
MALFSSRLAQPRSAYVHIPFCVHRCGYCNFAVVAGRDDLVEPFLSAIEIELRSLEVPQEVETLYFGGGTPTSLTPAQLERLCELVLRWHPLAQEYEWTVEANPGDLDQDRLEVLSRFGVNRLSLGAQSFRQEKLKRLERDHRADEICESVRLAREVGMRVSLDLLFAAPDESLDEWQTDLDEALRLEPEHISTYGLTFEKGTTFWGRLQGGNLSAAPEELERAMYLAAIDRLSAAGFEHYEVSNFAKPGERSRHNETYWSGESYFAAGPGAARYVGGVRETNHQSTTTYLKRVLAGKSPVAERECLDPQQRARELLVFGLRRLQGVERLDFRERSGIDLDQLAGPSIGRFVELGMLADDGRVVRLTREGLLVSDSLWPELI